MSKPDRASPIRRRLLKGAIATTVMSAGLPMINFGRYQVFAATSPGYSARTLRLIERSLVIDMLAPLKLDFTPEAFALPAGEQEVEMFRATSLSKILLKNF